MYGFTVHVKDIRPGHSITTGTISGYADVNTYTDAVLKAHEVIRFVGDPPIESLHVYPLGDGVPDAGYIVQTTQTMDRRDG